MRRAWTHKFQSSGPTVYSLYCGSEALALTLEVMAVIKDMQMKYDLLCSLLKDFEIEGVRRQCEMKVVDFISKSKAWNPFSKGKNGRDISTELLIPKHIPEKWQARQLRALK